MGIGILLTVTAVLMLCFGGGFILLPAQVFSMYGVELDPDGLMLARVAGAAVTALGLMAWLSRHADSKRVVVATLFCFFLIKSIVTLQAQLAGVFNDLGWSILLIDVPLAFLYGREMLRRSTPLVAK